MRMVVMVMVSPGGEGGIRTGTGTGTRHNCSVPLQSNGSVQDWVIGQLVKPPWVVCLPGSAISALAPNPSGRCYLHAHLFEV